MDIGLEVPEARPGQKLGWVYFVACSETRRCKIGYTRGNVAKRIKGLQTGSAGSLSLIAKHPGTTETERRLHARFAKQRLHGEWFEMAEELFTYICLTVWTATSIALRAGEPIEPWMRLGLRMIRDHTGNSLPPSLEALIK